MYINWTPTYVFWLTRCPKNFGRIVHSRRLSHAFGHKHQFLLPYQSWSNFYLDNYWNIKQYSNEFFLLFSWKMICHKFWIFKKTAPRNKKIKLFSPKLIRYEHFSKIREIKFIRTWNVHCSQRIDHCPYRSYFDNLKWKSVL